MFGWKKYGDLRFFIELFLKNIWYRNKSPFNSYQNNYYDKQYKVESENIPVYSFRTR